MTYVPIPETTVNTPFGNNLRLIVNSETHAQIVAVSPDEPKLTVNGVEYSGRIEFELHEGTWRVTRRQATYAEYVGGINLKRCDDWNKYPSAAAKQKLLNYFDGEFTEILASGTVYDLARDAQLRNAQAAVDRAQADFEEATRRVSEADRALNTAQIELDKLL